MKKFYFSLTSILLALFVCVGFASCSDDGDNKPSGNGGTITNYGIVTETGVRSSSLFASVSNGANTLVITGFAPVRAEGYYDIYKHIVTGIGLYSDDEGNEFAEWMPGQDIPTEFEKIAAGYSEMLMRTRIKGTDKYVYAYLDKERYLKESTGGMQGNVIGAVLKYQSPIDPATFKGFE